MGDRKVQWHPGFAAALDLELREYRADLQYEKEYNLNTKPLSIDLLVIKKKANVHIDNDVGKIFRGHNILEYKSPDDSLDIDTFYKVSGYACLYKSYGKMKDEIKADDVTVSMVRERRPTGLFRYFEEHGGYSLSNPYPGIYYVEGNVLFLTQIIVTGELEAEDHIWLRALSTRMRPQDMRRLFEYAMRLGGKYDRELVDSVLEISIRANEAAAEALLEEGEEMSGALLELVEPLIQKRERDAWNNGKNQGLSRGITQGITQGIHGSVCILRDMGLDDREIKRRIMGQYNLSEKTAEEYLTENKL